MATGACRLDAAAGAAAVVAAAAAAAASAAAAVGAAAVDNHVTSFLGSGNLGRIGFRSICRLRQ